MGGLTPPCRNCGWPGGQGDSPALKSVRKERLAQLDREGWTPSHDDSHTGNELAFAGALYGLNAAMNGGRQTYEGHHAIRELWPWSGEWWKPTTRRRDLVKAAALLVAEIERIDRANPGMVA